MKVDKIFGREPTLYIAVINAALLLIATFGLKWLSVEQAGLFAVVTNAILAAFNAWAVRPVSPVAFTYLVGAVAALLASYGFNLTPEQVSAIDSFVVFTLALMTRNAVSPVPTPVTNHSLEPTPEAARVIQLRMGRAA